VSAVSSYACHQTARQAVDVLTFFFESAVRRQPGLCVVPRRTRRPESSGSPLSRAIGARPRQPLLQGAMTRWEVMAIRVIIAHADRLRRLQRYRAKR
jgi:hypothetical protein